MILSRISAASIITLLIFNFSSCALEETARLDQASQFTSDYDGGYTTGVENTNPYTFRGVTFSCNATWSQKCPLLNLDFSEVTYNGEKYIRAYVHLGSTSRVKSGWTYTWGGCRHQPTEIHCLFKPGDQSWVRFRDGSSPALWVSASFKAPTVTGNEKLFTWNYGNNN